jgi:hypothetical protein
MLKHNGGETVGKGTYWNLSNGERVDIVSEGTPGDRIEHLTGCPQQPL